MLQAAASRPTTPAADLSEEKGRFENVEAAFSAEHPRQPSGARH
jgi:hypothetical protein